MTHALHHWHARILGTFFACLTAAALPSLAAPAMDMNAWSFDWEPVGLSGGGMVYQAAISPADPDVMMLGCDMTGTYITSDGGRHWRLIDHRQLRSDHLCQPAFHPKDRRIVYAPHGYTWILKVSRDLGEHWRTLSFVPTGLRGEIKIDPDYPQTIIVGGDDGASISHDGGRNWQVCEGVSGTGVSAAFDRSSPQEARVVFVATERGVWRSDDGGKTWRQKVEGLPHKRTYSFAASWYGRSPTSITTDDPAPFVLSFAGASDPATGCTVLYCSTPSGVEDGRFVGGVYRSRDLGEHWEWAMGSGINKDTHTYGNAWAPAPVAEYKYVVAADARPLTVYATNTRTGAEPPHNTGMFRSDDGGDTWRQTMYLSPRFKEFNLTPDYFIATERREMQTYATAVAIANSDPDRVIHAEGQIWITRDGGRTWKPGHTRLAAGQRPEPGAAWECNGLVLTATWHYYVDPFRPRRRYIAYTDIGLAISDDADASWRWWRVEGRAPWRNTCYELAFDPEVPGKMWGAFANVSNIPNSNIVREWQSTRGPGGVCLSTDFGETWTPLEGGLPEEACVSVIVDPRSPKGRRTLYAALFNAGVYKSTDDGRTWTKRSAGLGDPGNMRVCRLALHRDGTLFVLVTGKRKDNTFRPEGAGVYRSRDGGENWENITACIGLLWPKDFSVDPRSSDTIFVGAADADNGQGGLYRTTDGGRIWQRVAREATQHFGAYFDPRRPGWVYMTVSEVAARPSLWLSRDGGDTWRAIRTFPFAYAQRVDFDRTDPNVVYVTTFGAGVWRGRMW
jgi:photosystem II stability/assembly factor-like uncharacterized protein